jgi:hypothetical protein
LRPVDSRGKVTYGFKFTAQARCWVQKAYQFASERMHPGGDGHWIREIMDQETARLVGVLHFKQALEISGVQWKDFGFARHKSVGYPDFDICAGVLDEKFDIILAEQVFEHVLWPYRECEL